MPEPIDKELAQLRARAYGPDADIHDDPRSLARLRELEERRHVSASELSAVPSISEPDTSGPGLPPALPSPAFPSPPIPPRPPAPPVPNVAGAPGAAAAPAATAAESDASTATSRSFATPLARTLGIAATAAVIAAALSVPVTLWAAASVDAPRAVLEATDLPLSEDYFGAGSDAVRYEDFIGMRVTVGTFPGQLGRCMLIESDPANVDPDWASGTTQGTCSAPGFDPVVDVTVAQMVFNEEQLAVLGDATGVRFEASGDQVRVYLATAADDATGS